MPGYKVNPLDGVLNGIVQAMTQIDGHLAEMAKDVRPFDSKELTPQEDELLFHNPSLRYLGQVEPTTGMPYTNQQAAQRLLQEIGPSEYVRYVEDVVQRMDRRVNDAQSNSGAPTSGVTAPERPSQPQPKQAPERNVQQTPTQGLATGADQAVSAGGGQPRGTMGSGTMGGGTMGDSNSP